MAMQRLCDSCGEGYEAKTVRSRYCSDRCKRRFHRGARAVEKVVEVAPLVSGVGEVEEAVRSELEAAGRLSSSLGRAAVALACRMDGSSRETGAGLASLAKQLQVTLAAATADAVVESDPVDEVRAARDRKLRAVSG